MTDKALISDLTWRTIESQMAAFPDMPTFVVPYDLPSLLRPTTRKAPVNIHVVSLGVMAQTEKGFLELLTSIRKIKAHIIEAETATDYWPDCPIKNVVNAWKVARRDGSAKIGAKRSAEVKKAKSAEAVAKIKDRWPLPSKEWSTAVLLKEAGVSLNTAKSLLGKRPIAQYNYQAAQKRKTQRQFREHMGDIANGRD